MNLLVTTFHGPTMVSNFYKGFQDVLQCLIINLVLEGRPSIHSTLILQMSWNLSSLISESLAIHRVCTYLGEITNHCASCISTVLIMQLHW